MKEVIKISYRVQYLNEAGEKCVYFYGARDPRNLPICLEKHPWQNVASAEIYKITTLETKERLEQLEGLSPIARAIRDNPSNLKRLQDMRTKMKERCKAAVEKAIDEAWIECVWNDWEGRDLDD